MEFSLPACDAMLNGFQQIRASYLTLCEKNGIKPNPQRLELLDIQDVMVNVLKYHMTQDPGLTQQEAKELCFGIYLFGMYSIAPTYKFFGPEKAYGTIFNSGSEVYTLYLQWLGITSNNTPSPVDNIYCLAKLFHFFFVKQEKLFIEELNKTALIYAEISEKIKTIIQAVYKPIEVDTTKLLKALPTEGAIERKMRTMVKAYKQKTQSPDRLWLAQIIEAVSYLPSDTQQNEILNQFLGRSNRIKMFVLIYTIQSIWNEYWISSPKGKDALYDLACEALNIESLEDLDPQIRLACLTAGDTFFNETNVAQLEKKINELFQQNIYFDPLKWKIAEENREMIKQLTAYQPLIQASMMTTNTAALLRIMLAAPGYGTGFVIGDVTARRYSDLNNYVNQAMMHLAKKNSGYLGYYVTDAIVERTMERAFAKACEALAMATGTLIGGALGLVIFDLSYTTLKHLCDLITKVHQEFKLAQNFDPRLVECLMLLPSEIVSNDKKEKVQYLTQNSLFSTPKILPKSGPYPETGEIVQHQRLQVFH